MKRKMSTDERSQIDTIKKSFYRFYNYMIQQEGTSTVLESIKKLVDAAYDSNKLKILKSIIQEVRVMMREIMPALPPDGQELIQELLQQDSDKRKETLDTIKKRGKIINKKEYALVHSRVEEIYSNEEQAAELEQLNRLLSNFEK